MEYHARTGRRGRGRPRLNPLPNQHTLPQYSKAWTFLSGFYSYFIMTSLVAVVYLMLEYHCSACSAKCDLNNITKNIEDIAKNMTVIKDSYYDLELKISKFSQELPKIEGQIEILEALANTMESKNIQWDPKTDLTLPNVDVYLSRPGFDKAGNISQKCSRHISNLKPIVVNKD